ncbi:MAG: transcriptional regulator PpsR [Alphaproteobacteria bacterium]|nr:transcriptional regulator PpsR [Alphaproteobacteria bacterium]
MSMYSADSSPVGFQRPEAAFSELDASGAAELVAATADIALIVSPEGIITDLSFGQPELASQDRMGWVGRQWSDTVTIESKSKVEALLETAAKGETGRWRQVNHPVAGGADIPVLYNAVRLNRRGAVLAVGRDLRTLASLQQSLMDAQRTMERDYSKLREIETRYRQLFHLASEAVLVVDVASQQIQEANPAAAEMLDREIRKITGRSVFSVLTPKNRDELEQLLSTVRANGSGDDVIARRDGGKISVAASLFRQDRSTHYLIRLTQPDGAADEDKGGERGAASHLLRVIENAPEAFVVTDLDGGILTCNEAFLTLTQIGSEEQAAGEHIDQWLTRPGTSFSSLSTNLRTHGSISALPMTVIGSYGTRISVDVSAVAVMQGDPPCIGFMIRPEPVRINEAPSEDESPLPHSVNQLTELVGQVPLKDLVKETTDVIERLCIEAALKLTNNNRASASELLGLSRQSLYVKLRRYGLDGDGDSD